MTLADILKLIHSLEIVECFNEAEKLCSLALTFPLHLTSTVERSFSVLKRIKTYMQNKTNEERLSNLAIISIEKDIIHELKNKNIFYVEVTKVFVKSVNRRIDFIYK